MNSSSPTRSRVHKSPPKTLHYGRKKYLTQNAPAAPNNSSHRKMPPLTGYLRRKTMKKKLRKGDSNAAFAAEEEDAGKLTLTNCGDCFTSCTAAGGKKVFSDIAPGRLNDEKADTSLHPIRSMELKQQSLHYRKDCASPSLVQRPAVVGEMPSFCTQQDYYYHTVGHPSLRIYRLALPSQYHQLMEDIVNQCNAHASTLPQGWMTDLYSLTKQDIAFREVPQLYDRARPITSYLKRAMSILYGIQVLKVDQNQPHILKYSLESYGSSHTGVELHHDKCAYTASLMLSKSSAYEGGGTYFPDADTIVRLEYGEFLLHPGRLVHGGAHITRGSRYLMVMFANVKH